MGMIDRLKAFAKNEKPATLPTGDIGYASSMIYMNKHFSAYNPDDLMIRRSCSVYQSMMIDDQVKAVIAFKKNAVVSRKWHFDVATEDNGEPVAEQAEQADILTEIIHGIKGSFKDNLVSIMSAYTNGFSVTEMVFAPVEIGGRTYWGIADLKLRPFDTFTFECDVHGNVEGIVQNVGDRRIDIPEKKVIHFVHQPDVDRNYGRSDLRAAYRPYFSKDFVIKAQNIHLERHASGFLWAEVEGGLTTTQQSALEDLLNNVSARMSAHVPKGVKLNQMQPMSTDAFEKAVAQHDKSIAKSALVPNLLGLSEQGNTGSYSQSQTQMDAFFMTLDTDADRLVETINDQMISVLAKINFDTTEFPRFMFEPMSDDRKFEIAKGWNELVKGGSVTKSDADEAWIRGFMGAPDKPEDDEEEVDPNAPGTMPDENMPVEEPDNEQWITDRPDGVEIQSEFAEKPWLARCDFARIETALDDQDEHFADGLAASMGKVKINIIKQIAKIAGDRSFGNVKPKEIETVMIPSGVKSEIRRVIRASLKAVMDEGYETASKELPKKAFAQLPRGVGMDKTRVDQILSARTMRISGVIERDVLNAVNNVLENAIKYDKTLTATVEAIADDTTLLQVLPEVDAAGRAINVPARLKNIARTNNADAINQGRQALFGSPEFFGFVRAYEYSAILDSETTDVCASLHGLIRRNWAERTPPNHFQCRSILVPVTVVDEWSGKESRIPAGGTPQKGFA